ncbi:MAG: ribose 5-phosphate isomerase B [Chloroherpetonaceae bacterium]|nr:ribose 5-phosphate isomerase B [Chloroherpetonaceae bacterium]MDW8438401.1 ribose 5-phosphate isomerase B [Chloroherpetonaceae bacterium]
MKIAIGSDHAGFEAKKIVADWLRRNGYETIDKGTFSPESVDYPDFAKAVAQSVAQGEAEQGVLLCGSGVGVSIVANKVKGVRAALVFNEEIAHLSREHNDANVMCLPARFLAPEQIERCLTNWFRAKFEGGRHARRVAKIEA